MAAASAEDGGPETFLGIARNACQRRGRKSTDRHCGKVIEAQPTLGQISPSEAAMAPPRIDRERLDDRRELLTRGRDPTARNQVRIRINGGKTAAANNLVSPKSTSLKR